MTQTELEAQIRREQADAKRAQIERKWERDKARFHSETAEPQRYLPLADALREAGLIE